MVVLEKALLAADGRGVKILMNQPFVVFHEYDGLRYELSRVFVSSAGEIVYAEYSHGMNGPARGLDD